MSSTVSRGVDEAAMLVIYGSKKRKNEPTSKSPSESILERTAKNDFGRDFTIKGPKGMQWRVSVEKAAILGHVVDHCLKASPPTHVLDLGDKYLPLVIDFMVYALHWHRYSVPRDRKFLFCDNADDFSKDRALNHYVPIFLHLKVYELAKAVNYPELMDMALEHIRSIVLSLSTPMTIHDFKNVVKYVWSKMCPAQGKETFSDERDEALCRLLATFGACWDLAWLVNHEDIWEELTCQNGPFSLYAHWHRDAMKDKRLKMRGKEAPIVMKALPRKEEEEQAAVKEEHDDQE